MKQENINSYTKKQNKKFIVNIILDVVFTLVTVFVLNWLCVNVFSSELIIIIARLMMIGLIINLIATPFLIYVRMKEIKKGELYEASKY